MAIKTRIIPFNWYPGSWALKGEFYDRAEAYYIYDGYDLDARLAEIDHGVSTPEYYKRLAQIDFEYGNITEFERDQRICEQTTYADEIEREVAEMEVEIKHGKTDEKQARKYIATLRGEPWVAIVNEGYDPALGPSGLYFEFDWNDLWIEKLRQHGYTGATEEDIVQQWFLEVCRNETASSVGQTFNNGVVYSVDR